MRVERIAVDLSRRSMAEAADLGVRLVSSHAREVWASIWPPYAFAVALAAIALEAGPGWAMLALLCLKPWIDRSILFVLSRAVFGERSRFADLAAQWRPLWFGSLLATLTLRRISPWRSFVQPAQQLEGLRGSPLYRRVRLLLGSHHGAALGMQTVFAALETCLVAAIGVLPTYFFPVDSDIRWFDHLLSSGSGWVGAVQFGCYAAAVALLEPFFVGAGFAMYLNRRVELEAWDIEQEFRVVFAPA